MSCLIKQTTVLELNIYILGYHRNEIVELYIINNNSTTFL